MQPLCGASTPEVARHLDVVVTSDSDDSGSRAGLHGDELGYDNFPCWSAKGRIVFSWFVNDEFHIFATNPDGTSLTQLKKGPYDDTHPACAPNGEHVLFSTSRFGFKDEAPMFNIPQPYGELIIMKADGSDQRPLTDNRWEEGTSAWQTVPATGAATIMR